MNHRSTEIPVIDMLLLSNGQKEELNNLDMACKEWSFYQVVNHGLAKEILQNMKEAAAEFFDLQIQEKNKFSMASDDIQGYGHACVLSEQQKLDRELMQALRVNYYPTCSKPDLVSGISPHPDTSTISILLQEDDFDGIQIRHDGEWVPVKQIPNALVMNIRDVIEIWSDGKYKSIKHRAVTNENKEIISFALLLFRHDDVEIEQLDHMIDSSRPHSMYKVRYGDYLRQCMKRRMQGKSNTQMAMNETRVHTLTQMAMNEA
ncbi:oxoglutarate-dependent flavonoid 7-O-demethylase 1-like [Actinidia eriantha]|uniref:oxoglutarate-dependent flavonoid 7-O-demethylase 1-like n=1 Tax=Actinidia eriantha TaxID=165200 RepID=UPI002589202B|nr:oxoglutarate-dependent flavonoid 7-O-demethylase 1-like [Actinidia eriantha]